MSSPTGLLRDETMWMSDPSGGVSQSMLIGFGIWVSFAYLWTFAPKFGVRRDVAVACFGLGGVGGMLGARLLWWWSQGMQRVGGLWEKNFVLEMLNPMVAGYSSMGFLAGAGLVILGMLRFGKFGEGAGIRVLDVVVPAGFLGLVFARLGCVLNGCDFGKVSSEYALSIRYARGSEAWQQHLVEGLIGNESMWSLPTHGFAVYSAAATLVIVVGASVVAKTQDFGQRMAGVVASRAVMAFCGVQFALEFLRESSLGGNGGVLLTLNQIALMGVVFFGIAMELVHAVRKTESHREL